MTLTTGNNATPLPTTIHPPLNPKGDRSPTNFPPPPPPPAFIHNIFFSPQLLRPLFIKQTHPRPIQLSLTISRLFREPKTIPSPERQVLPPIRGYLHKHPLFNLYIFQYYIYYYNINKNIIHSIVYILFYSPPQGSRPLLLKPRRRFFHPLVLYNL